MGRESGEKETGFPSSSSLFSWWRTFFSLLCIRIIMRCTHSLSFCCFGSCHQSKSLERKSFSSLYKTEPTECLLPLSVFFSLLLFSWMIGCIQLSDAAFVRIRLWHHEKEKRLWRDREYTYTGSERKASWLWVSKAETGQNRPKRKLDVDAEGFWSTGNKENEMTASWHTTWNFGHHEVRERRKNERVSHWFSFSKGDSRMTAGAEGREWNAVYHMRLMICGPVKRREKFGTRRERMRGKKVKLKSSSLTPRSEIYWPQRLANRIPHLFLFLTVPLPGFRSFLFPASQEWVKNLCQAQVIPLDPRTDMTVAPWFNISIFSSTFSSLLHVTKVISWNMKCLPLFLLLLSLYTPL